MVNIHMFILVWYKDQKHGSLTEDWSRKHFQDLLIIEGTHNYLNKHIHRAYMCIYKSQIKYENMCEMNKKKYCFPNQNNPLPV